MYNYFLLVGKLNRINVPEESIELIDKAPFKNEKGKFETQIITLRVPHPLIDIVAEGHTENAIYGIKGRIVAEGKTNILLCERVKNLSEEENKKDE